jgi:hypothetical protein
MRQTWTLNKIFYTSQICGQGRIPQSFAIHHSNTSENCQTVGDIAALLNEMPPKVKADLKELVGNRQDEIKQA